jgi:hypothetical protein
MTEEEYEDDFINSPKKSNQLNFNPTVVQLQTISETLHSIPTLHTPASSMSSACAALEQLSQAVHVGFISSHSLLVSPRKGVVKSYKSLSTSSGTPRIRGYKLELLSNNNEDQSTLQDEEAAAAAVLSQNGDVNAELERRRNLQKIKPSGKRYTSPKDGADTITVPTMVNSLDETASKTRSRQVRSEQQQQEFENDDKNIVQNAYEEEEEAEEEGGGGKEEEEENHYSQRNSRNSKPKPIRTVSYENESQETLPFSSSSSSFSQQQARRARLATSLLRNKITDVPQIPINIRPLSSSMMRQKSETTRRSSMKGSRSLSGERDERLHERDEEIDQDQAHVKTSNISNVHVQPRHRIASFNKAMQSKTSSSSSTVYSSTSANGHGVGLAPPTFNPVPPYGFGGVNDGTSRSSTFNSSHFFSGTTPLPVLVSESGRFGGNSMSPKTMYLWDHPPPSDAAYTTTPSGGSPTRDGGIQHLLPRRRPSLSDDVLLQLFLLSQYKGQTKEEKRIDLIKRETAQKAGLIVSAPHVPLSVLNDGPDIAKTFANSLKNEQALLLLKHGSGGMGSTTSSTSQKDSTSQKHSTSALDAPVNPSVLAALWGGVFDRLFSHVVINLPRLVAEASLSCSAVITSKEDDEDNEGQGKHMLLTKQATPLPLPLSLAVGHPILTSLQDMLTDVDVLTLVREAVAAKIQVRLSQNIPLSTEKEEGVKLAEKEKEKDDQVSETVV